MKTTIKTHSLFTTSVVAPSRVPRCSMRESVLLPGMCAHPWKVAT
jgi:hypothetical protein